MEKEGKIKDYQKKKSKSTSGSRALSLLFDCGWMAFAWVAGVLPLKSSSNPLSSSSATVWLVNTAIAAVRGAMATSLVLSKQ